MNFQKYFHISNSTCVFPHYALTELSCITQDISMSGVFLTFFAICTMCAGTQNKTERQITALQIDSFHILLGDRPPALEAKQGRHPKFTHDDALTYDSKTPSTSGIKLTAVKLGRRNTRTEAILNYLSYSANVEIRPDESNPYLSHSFI